MSGRQHRLIPYLLTFKIIWEGNHVEQIVSEFILVDEFWCRKNEVWNFSKMFVYFILGQCIGHTANNSSFLPSLKFWLSGNYIRSVPWGCSSKVRLWSFYGSAEWEHQKDETPVSTLVYWENNPGWFIGLTWADTYFTFC